VQDIILENRVKAEFRKKKQFIRVRFFDSVPALVEGRTGLLSEICGDGSARRLEERQRLQLE